MFLEQQLSDDPREIPIWDNSVALYGERVAAGR